METARACQDPMVNNVGTLAWMIKLCVQGDTLNSHLNSHPCAARSADFKCQECGLHFADVAGLKLHQKRVHQLPTLPPVKGDFRQHSVDGMPVCRFCMKDLKTWHNFCRHFAGRHCSVMWRAQQEALQDTPGQQEDVATPRQDAGPSAGFERQVSSTVDRNQPSEGTHVQEVDTPLRQIRALGKPLNQWMEIVQNTHILEQLKHRCCVCSQWIANIRSVKLHVLKVHPEIYNTAGAAALADCKKKSGASYPLANSVVHR